MGLHYKDVIPDENGVVHNNAGRTIDDLWPTFADEEQALEYVQNLVSDGRTADHAEGRGQRSHQASLGSRPTRG